MEILALFVTGILPGALHVFTQPDHLAAIVPLSVDAGRGAWRVGLRWGVGHAVGLIVVGLAAYAAREQLEFELLAEYGEPLVGLVLIGIAVWGFYHLRSLPEQTDRSSLPAHVHTGAALLIGMLHGAFGTGAVLGLLPALAQSSWPAAASFLGGFGIGTVVAMVGVASFAGLAHGPRYRLVFGLASAACLLIGLTWLPRP